MPETIDINGDVLSITSTHRFAIVVGAVIAIVLIAAPLIVGSLCLGSLTIPLAVGWVALIWSVAVKREHIEIDRKQLRVSAINRRRPEETVTRLIAAGGDEVRVLPGRDASALSASHLPTFHVVLRSELDVTNRNATFLAKFRKIGEAREFAEQIAAFAQLPFKDEN